MDTDDLAELTALRAFLRSGAARSVRTAAGASLTEVGKPLGVSKTTVLRWERGERVPRGTLALRYWELIQRLMDGSP